MIFHKGIGWQSSPLTPIQKSLTGVDEDGAKGTKAYDSIIVVDEINKSEFQMFANKADLRAALLEAEQRGDVRVKSFDIALADRGRIRKSVAEVLYPNAKFPGDQIAEDGTPFRKALPEPVRKAFESYDNDHSNTYQDLKAAAEELDALVRRQNG